MPPIHSTRQRILECATKAFAANGFHATSVRALTSNAGVNVAAVAYHFGNKEGLYREVLRTQIEQLPFTTLMPRSAGGTWEQRLEQFFSDLLSIMAVTTKSSLHQILVREDLSPSEVLGDELGLAFQTRHESLCAALGEELALPAQHEVCLRLGKALIDLARGYACADAGAALIHPYLFSATDWQQRAVQTLTEQARDLVAGAKVRLEAKNP